MFMLSPEFRTRFYCHRTAWIKHSIPKPPLWRSLGAGRPGTTRCETGHSPTNRIGSHCTRVTQPRYGRFGDMDMKTYLRLMVAIALCIPFTVFAGMYKLAVPEKSGTEAYWWPILPDLPGWVHDEVASRRFASNFLVPRGQTFANAPAVIYAKALYKPRIPDTQSVDQLIADDERQVAKQSPGIRISEQAALQDRDGKGFKCIAYAPSSEGSWGARRLWRGRRLLSDLYRERRLAGRIRAGHA